MTAVLKDAAHHTAGTGAQQTPLPHEPQSDAQDEQRQLALAAKEQAAAANKAVMDAYTVHAAALMADAAMPGLRNEILELLLPIEASARISHYTRHAWNVGDPLPPGADPASFIRVIQTVRTLTPMTTFTLKGEPLGIDLVHLQIRLHGQSRELTTTRRDFDTLKAPIGVWTNIFGSISNKRSRAPRPR